MLNIFDILEYVVYLFIGFAILYALGVAFSKIEEKSKLMRKVFGTDYRYRTYTIFFVPKHIYDMVSKNKKQIETFMPMLNMYSKEIINVESIERKVAKIYAKKMETGEKCVEEIVKAIENVYGVDALRWYIRDAYNCGKVAIIKDIILCVKE